MSLELFKVGANGQLEFDFESLAALTSQSLVDDLKSHMMASDFDLRFESRIVKCEFEAITASLVDLHIVEYWRDIEEKHEWAKVYYQYSFDVVKKTFRLTYRVGHYEAKAALKHIESVLEL
jgi:hypothetical protein